MFMCFLYRCEFKYFGHPEGGTLRGGCWRRGTESITVSAFDTFPTAGLEDDPNVVVEDG